MSAERSDGRQEGKKGDRKSRSGEVAKAWRDGEMEKVKQLFPEVPEPIMEQALGSGGGKGSSWNRAARRRHARSAGVILHLLAGKSAKKFNYGELDREVIYLVGPEHAGRGHLRLPGKAGGGRKDGGSDGRTSVSDPLLL